MQLSSWGGKLPASVVASRENLDVLNDYLNALPELSTDEEIKATFTAATPEGDLSSYLEYVRRGLFAFDRVDDNHYSGIYCLVARPPRPLRAGALPLEIAAIVTHTPPLFSCGIGNLRYYAGGLILASHALRSCAGTGAASAANVSA
ncbi:MAG TPA: hypothetical protein VF629_21625 [Hymenobacter sp.]|uniref:hypothetical protein n=1 Tax=Hymenobacter sp. TaxID=1898978 RepID=UPI002ED853E3